MKRISLDRDDKHSDWLQEVAGTLKRKELSSEVAKERDETSIQKEGSEEAWKESDGDIQKFPAQEKVLSRLPDYGVVEEHDDGDLTLGIDGKLYVLTTSGDLFAQIDSEEVKSQSSNLILDSAKHLNGLMKDLTRDLPPVDIKQLDVERVQTACLCAKQITELMRVQMDAIKLVGGK